MCVPVRLVCVVPKPSMEFRYQDYLKRKRSNNWAKSFASAIEYRHQIIAGLSAFEEETLAKTAVFKTNAKSIHDDIAAKFQDMVAVIRKAENLCLKRFNDEVNSVVKMLDVQVTSAVVRREQLAAKLEAKQDFDTGYFDVMVDTDGTDYSARIDSNHKWLRDRIGNLQTIITDSIPVVFETGTMAEAYEALDRTQEQVDKARTTLFHRQNPCLKTKPFRNKRVLETALGDDDFLAVHSVAVHHDGCFLATNFGGRVKVYGLPTGKMVATFMSPAADADAAMPMTESLVSCVPGTTSILVFYKTLNEVTMTGDHVRTYPINGLSVAVSSMDANSDVILISHEQFVSVFRYGSGDFVRKFSFDSNHYINTVSLRHDGRFIVVTRLSMREIAVVTLEGDVIWSQSTTSTMKTANFTAHNEIVVLLEAEDLCIYFPFVNKPPRCFGEGARFSKRICCSNRNIYVVKKPLIGQFSLSVYK